MDLRRLRYFVIVAEELSFRRAARRLGISQPAVTNRIAALEEELGFDLMVRDKQRIISLTTAGRHYLDHVRKALADLSHMHQATLAIAGEGCPPVRIGLCESRNVSGTRAALRGLHRNFPGRKWHYLEMAPNFLVDAVLREEVDLIFSDRIVHHADLHCEPLYSESWVAIVSRNHRLAARERLTPCDLDGVDVIMPRPALGIFDPVADAFHVAGITPRVALFFTRRTTMFTLAAADIGVGFAPASYAQMGLPGLAILPFEAASAMTYLVCRAADVDGLAHPLAVIRDAVRAYLAERSS